MQFCQSMIIDYQVIVIMVIIFILTIFVKVGQIIINYVFFF